SIFSRSRLSRLVRPWDVLPLLALLRRPVRWSRTRTTSRSASASTRTSCPDWLIRQRNQTTPRRLNPPGFSFRAVPAMSKRRRRDPATDREVSDLVRFAAEIRAVGLVPGPKLPDDKAGAGKTAVR